MTMVAPQRSVEDGGIAESNGAIFDFAIFRRAFETQDVAAWLDCFAEDAQWIEFHADEQSGLPKRMIGKSQIGAFLGRLKASNVRLTIYHEIVGTDGCAFSVLTELSDGRRILEHAILHIVNGKIVRQVDIEVWD